MADKVTPIPIKNRSKNYIQEISENSYIDNLRTNIDDITCENEINEQNSSINYGERNDSKMDDNKILEKYLDKVDQDRREQEERLSNNMQLMEQRLTEERRLSEERMEKRYNQIMESIQKTNEKIDNTFDKMNDKFENVTNEVKENNKYIRSII